MASLSGHPFAVAHAIFSCCTLVSSATQDCSYYIMSLGVLAAFTYNQTIAAWEAGGCEHLRSKGLCLNARCKHNIF